MRLLAIGSAFIFSLAVSSQTYAVDLDPALPPYKAKAVGDATFTSVGSDTLGELMRLWVADFTKLNPNVTFQIESKGSGTAAKALLDETAQLGPMSRPMREEEYAPLEKKYGAHPISLAVAVDALAVYVNKDNPIQCLTTEQLDQIFSKSHLFSGGKDVRDWGGAGLTGDWAPQSIHLFGRNAESGTYDTFVENVLAHGEFKDELKQQPGSVEVVRMVANDKLAIGYSGIGYLTDGVRTVPLAANAADKCHPTTPEETYAGSYPLSRYLYIYLNNPQSRPLNPALLEFIRYIVSKDGQNGTLKAGFYPIRNQTRLRDLSALGISETSD